MSLWSIIANYQIESYKINSKQMWSLLNVRMHYTTSLQNSWYASTIWRKFNISYHFLYIELLRHIIIPVSPLVSQKKVLPDTCHYYHNFDIVDAHISSPNACGDGAMNFVNIVSNQLGYT